VSLKNPSELFEGKSPSINVNDINHIKEEFNRVEEIRKQLNDVSSSLDNSLTEAVDKNLNFLSNEYSDQLDKFNSKINSFKEEINNKVDDFRKTNQILKADIAIVEQRQNRINLSQIKEEVLSDVQNILSGDVKNNIKRLEEKIDIVKDSYKQTLNEGLLNEPPSTNNSDPLTPLDKKLTLEELQKHYTLFLNRIQQQVATIGGGGAVNIREMDDVDLSTAQVNNKFLKYDSATAKWVGSDTSGGGYTLPVGSATTLGGVKVGSGLTITATGILSTTGGDGSIAGINTTGTSYFNQIIASGTVTGNAFSGDGSGLTGITGSGSGIVVKNSGSVVGTAGTINFGNNLSVSPIHLGIVTVTGSAGSGSTEFISAQTLAVAGLSTFNGVTKFDNVDVVFQGAAAGQNMTWDASENDLEFTDSARIKFGDSDDLEIWHSGNSHIKNSVNDLKIRSDSILLKRADDSEKYLECNVNNAVHIFYNNNEKFATTNTGINVTGDVQCSDNILLANNIKHVGDTDTYIEFTDDQIRLLAGGKGILTVTEASIDSVVINNGGNNCDFRVEGLNDENLIFSDGSTDRVGIGSEIPTQKLDVAGAVKATTYHGDGSNLTGISAGALDTRGTTSAATGSIAQNASGDITISTRGKTFSLLKVAISAPAWVVLYVDSASRSSDSSRTEGTDPAPGSGVLTEVSTTTSGASTFLMSPAVLGWNNDSTPAAQIYAKVKNKRSNSGSNAITVTLTTIKLEA